MKKKCKKCRADKTPKEFYKRIANKDGLNTICIECCRQAALDNHYKVALRKSQFFQVEIEMAYYKF